MSPSRSSDILKGNQPEHNDSTEKGAVETPNLVSLTSEAPKPAKTETTTPQAPKPEAKPSINATIVIPIETATTTQVASADQLMTRTPLAATQGPRLANLVSTNNESQAKFEERKSASLAGRFGIGLRDNLVGQAQGIMEMGYGKKDQVADLTSTLTGKKTGNEHVLVNLTKTTLNVAEVVKNVAADTVGLGDGKTNAAIGRAINKTYTDFVNGSAGDRLEFAGQATGFVGTLLVGGGATAKGAQNLSTDVRALRTLIQTEKQTAALSEAVTGMKALRPVVAEAGVVGAEDLTRVAAATARTTTVGTPSRLATAWSRFTEGTAELANKWVRPGMTPELVGAGAGGGTVRIGGSSSTALVRAENTATKSTSFLRAAGEEGGILSGRGTTGLVRNPGARVAGATEEIGLTGGRQAETVAAKGKVLTEVEGGAGKVHVPGGRVVETPAVHPTEVVPKAKTGGASSAAVVEDATAQGRNTARVAGHTIEDATVVRPTVEVRPGANAAEVKAGGHGVPEVKPGQVAPEVKTGQVVPEVKTGQVAPEIKTTGQGAQVHPTEVHTPSTAHPIAGEVRPVEVQPAVVNPVHTNPVVALENGTKSIAATGETLSADATRLAETTGKAVKGDLDEIARLGKNLGKGDDVATVTAINERLGNISRTAGKDVADEIARTLKPGLQKAEATALENGAIKSAQNIEQRIARMTEGLTGTEAAVVRENLTAVQTGTRQLAGGADNAAQVNANIEQALRNLETTAGKGPLSDDIAKLARETRELQTSVNGTHRLAAIETNTRTIATAGDDIAREVGNLAPRIGKENADEIAKISQTLGKGGDDLQAIEQLNQRLANISRTHGADVADEVARTLKPAMQKAETTALENGALRSAQNIEQRIARMTENLTGTEAAVVRENLTAVQTGTRQLAGTADNATQVNANIEQALRNLETTAGKGPLSDDIARLAKDTRELQASVNGTRRLAAIESNSRVIATAGDDVTREIGRLAPKLEQADAQTISKLAENLGKGGDDLQIIRKIDEQVANISRTKGADVADEVARALKPALQKAETTAIESNTLRSVSNIERSATRLAENLTGPEAAWMRKDIATIQQNAQKLVSGADDAAATASLERAMADLKASGAGTRHADDIARLTQETRELQSTVSVARRIETIEANSRTIATSGTRLSEDAARLAADPLKAVAKNDLDEISRLGQNLGRGGDDVATVRAINERLANISKTAGTDVAEDIARTLKPTVQGVEAKAVESGALRNAANLEQRIGRVAEQVTGTEAAAIRENLAQLQRSTRGFVNNADQAAAHSDDITRALQNLERAGVKSNVADDIAQVSREARELQVSVNASRRVSAIENSTRTLANDGRAISDEVARIAAGPGKAAKADLDEISRLSNNLGRTGDDLDTIRKINDRMANIGKTAGADADDITRALAPRVQRAEATAIESSRLRTIDQAATTVEREARTISNVTRDVVKTLDTSTTQGRTLQQQMQAIQRAADELPTAVNPATDAARLRTMVTAVEKSVPDVERAALRTAVGNLDNAATEANALRTIGNATPRIEQATTTLRGTVTTIEREIADGTRVLKPGTEDAVRRALTTIDENSLAVQQRMGTTARVDREIREIRSAIATLEEAGQKPLAQQFTRQLRELDNANTIRSFEVTAQQGPILSHVASQQTLVARTIDQIETDMGQLRTWGNIRGEGKLDVLNSLQENLQMLRYIARNDGRLMQYVDNAQALVSRIEVSALSRGGAAIERGTARDLIALAQAGDPQAINRLFINGLQSQGWTTRALADGAMAGPQTLMGRLSMARIMMRPEFWRIGGRMTADLALTGAGVTTLYANYKYHSNLLLNAIEAQMQQQSMGTSPTDFRREANDKPNDTKGDGSNSERRADDSTTVKRADLDFSPAVSQIVRRVNFSPADNGLAARYGFSADDPNAPEKANDIINFGKLRHWSAIGGVPQVVEEAVRQPIQTAKTIRVKGPDGMTFDPTNRPKTAVTSFSFTRAQALTNQLKLMTASNDNRGGSGRMGSAFGGNSPSSSSPTLSQNLRTMVAFNTLRNEGGSSHAALQHRESTEDGGLDQSGSGGQSIPGVQVVGLGGLVDPLTGNNITPGGATVQSPTIQVAAANAASAANTAFLEESQEKETV